MIGGCYRNYGEIRPHVKAQMYIHGEDIDSNVLFSEQALEKAHDDGPHCA